MSVSIFKIFVNTLRQNLPKYSKPGLQYRFVTGMEVASSETKEEPEVRDKHGTRYKKRYVKRQWEELSGVKEDGETGEKRLCEKPTERIKRKKMAMLLGYSGVDYYGMQRNPGVRTIEEDLFKALWDAKYITEDDYYNQQNAQFQRSSRTDKGVSAARQVVSLKLPVEAKVEEINKRLPDCIKVFGIKRVTNKFNSKCKCSARTYSYTLPTYAFDATIVEMEDKKKYRLPSDKLKQIGDILSVFSGTKNYHNFTAKKHFHDPSAIRYMMGFSIEKVFVESDMEFAVLLVKGQSFMLHQIRKMVGLTIAIMRGHTDMSILDKAFGKEKVMVPTAPGLGLVLDMVHYDRYDTKFKESHGTLTWQDVEDSVQMFKQDHIYPNIVKGEIEEDSMGLWLAKLSGHSYDPADEQAEKEDIDANGDDDSDGESENVKARSNKEKPKLRKEEFKESAEINNIGKEEAEKNSEVTADIERIDTSDCKKIEEVIDDVEKSSVEVK